MIVRSSSQSSINNSKIAHVGLHNPPAIIYYRRLDNNRYNGKIITRDSLYDEIGRVQLKENITITIFFFFFYHTNYYCCCIMRSSIVFGRHIVDGAKSGCARG